jgi:hypothetical protein
MKRRHFLKLAAGTSASFGLTGFSLLQGLPPISAAEAQMPALTPTLHPELIPLVRLLEDTPRERVLEEVGSMLKKGTSYRELLGALLLAGVRNVEPRPIGFKFHAVLVVHAAHLASLASPDADRWLPIFWAIDSFKASQAADVREGNWTMGPINESAVPPSHKAKQALIDALERWDEPAADAAITGLVRTAGAHEIYDVLARYGARDFREIGHKEIYVANCFRTLEVIGWHHAEPVLRSLVYGLLDRVGDKNPAKSDLPADRPFRRNVELIKSIRSGWLDGKASSDSTKEMLRTLREGSAKDAAEKVVELLNRGTSPVSLFEACFAAAGEFVMRAPGIVSMHAITFTNATHYSWQHTRDEDTRKLLLLQNAAFLPLFRGTSKDKGIYIDQLEAISPSAAGPEAVEEILRELGPGDRLTGSRKILGYLNAGGPPKPLIDAARRLIFLKGRDNHDYKFSAAVWEDFQSLSPQIRDRFLAASSFHWRGGQESDNELMPRVRAALQG